ncbi:hypothetical protein ACA910_013608 [Epithemia clementina (nom. ined.)]
MDNHGIAPSQVTRNGSMSLDKNNSTSTNNLQKRRKSQQQPFILQDVVTQMFCNIWGDDVVNVKDGATAKLLDSTREALRLLAIRVPVGQLHVGGSQNKKKNNNNNNNNNKTGKMGGGRGGDRQEARAAILLHLMILQKQQQQQQQQQQSQQQQHQHTAAALMQSSFTAEESKILTPIPLEQLAGKVGMQSNSFQELYSKIRTYYFSIQQGDHPQSSSRQPNAQSFGLKQKSLQQQSGSNNNNNNKSINGRGSLLLQSQQQPRQRPQRLVTCQALLTTLENEKGHLDNIVPDLVFRLALYLRDPHAILQKTIQALKEFLRYTIQQASTMPTAQQRQDYEYDVVRFWPAYQAAMLYHFATPSSSSSSSSSAAFSSHYSSSTSKNNKKNRKSNTNAASSSSTAVSNHNNKSDYDEGVGGGPAILDLEALVQASSSTFTYMEVREKLPYIQQWHEDAKTSQKQHQDFSNTTTLSLQHNNPKNKMERGKKLLTTTTTTTLKRRRGENFLLQSKQPPHDDDDAVEQSPRKQATNTTITALDLAGPDSNRMKDLESFPKNRADFDMTTNARATLDAWKSSILDAACQAAAAAAAAQQQQGNTSVVAQQQGNTSVVEALATEPANRHDMLQLAANHVLVKYGLKSIFS